MKSPSHCTPLFFGTEAGASRRRARQRGRGGRPEPRMAALCVGVTGAADLRVTALSDTELFISSQPQSTLQLHCDASFLHFEPSS